MSVHSYPSIRHSHVHKLQNACALNFLIDQLLAMKCELDQHRFPCPSLAPDAPITRHTCSGTIILLVSSLQPHSV